MSKGTIVIVGGFRFPNKDAAAKRVLGLGFALRAIGYKVIFAGGEQGVCELKTYEGFDYFSQSELDKDAQRSKFKKAFDFFKAGNNTRDWLKTYLINSTIDYVLLYNSSFIFLRKLEKFCKSNKIKFITDCTEWYDPQQLPGGKLGLVNLDNSLKMRYGYKRQKNLIVISSYLLNYYSNFVSNIIIIPPLLLSNQENPLSGSSMIESDYLKVIYAGSPGKKDNLIKIINVINLEPETFVTKVKFFIFGIGREQFLIDHPICEIPKNVFFVGRISHLQVLEEYNSSDFSILIRPKVRYSDAGFSTKFVESLSMGVPVISTNTSDISLYLKDNVNGFILNDDSEIEIKNCFKKIIKLKSQDLKILKIEAIKESRKFYYGNYVANIEKFLRDSKL